LHWPHVPQVEGDIRLRVSVALDEREAKRAAAVLPQSGKIIGVFDIRYAHIFQPFEIIIHAEDANAIRDAGLGLRLEMGEKPLWLLHEQEAEPALMPHLLIASPPDPRQALIDRLASLASLQFFGWQEGCVLNGLLDLADSGLIARERVRQTVQEHFRFFFNDAGKLSYEDDYSRPRKGEIYGIECTLPFAALAQVQPDHPALHDAIAFWLKAAQAGSIQDADMLSAEGGYTVAYPMTALALTLNRPELIEIALHQLRLRCDRLFTGETFWLRVYDDGRRTFRNWCRGVAWYMLGLARTLALLPDPPADLRAALAQAATWIVMHQREDGLWSCFVDEAAVLPDTSGSAGIAAALALGCKHALLDAHMLAAARRTLAGLVPYLTPDGFLGGVAQVNKAGEPLQRSNYRVISQFGMGLMAQLLAAEGT
jgi:rhamnogalacturonyl hydrolase YesR